MSVSKIEQIRTNVEANAAMSYSLSNWRILLAKECQVYVFGEIYLAKRFDQIHFTFCGKDTAKEILVDNLYALLRFKYFPKTSEEIDERIKKIVDSFTINLKTTLHKVSFDSDTDCEKINQLPDGCVAFRNGVYDFRNDKWFFKYDIIKLEALSNKIYLYRNDYIISWYMNYDFEPLPVSIQKFPINDFIGLMKSVTSEKSNRNYCFELLYNICHDSLHRFSESRFVHLCEILGYTMLQSFSQNFIMLIGAGQNGKNSLFDGCFTNRLIPRPASNSMDAIENDRFVTGSLENKPLNIFLETSAKVYRESTMIKALTGSMYQTIEQKGVQKYSGIVNCKYVFAGNDQDNIKFTDTTRGFMRRINMYEIYYQWDSSKLFLKKGDYYDCTFSDSLKELTENTLNTTIYIYFAMYGIMHGTKNFTTNFGFSMNDWSTQYSDIDFDLKEKILRIGIEDILKHVKATIKSDLEDAKSVFYDSDGTRLYNSPSMSKLGVYTFEQMMKNFEDDEFCSAFFVENSVYIPVKLIQKLAIDIDSSSKFVSKLKKLFSTATFSRPYLNRAYIKCTFRKQKLIFVK